MDLGPDTVLCSGNSLLLSAPSGTVLWDDGSSATSRTLTQGGTYWVQVSTNGCSAADTITVAEVAPPTVDLGPDTSLCAGEVLWVDVTVGGGSYVWNDGNAGDFTISGADADETLGLLVEGTRLTRTEVDQGGEGDTPVLAVRLSFEVSYWTQPVAVPEGQLPLQVLVSWVPEIGVNHERSYQPVGTYYREP